MSLLRVKEVSGSKSLEVLAGANASGLPLGTIIAIYSNHVPTGYLPCNGTTFDETQYTALFTLLGTNILPDLRECHLVGIGQNTTELNLASHDVYTLGEFKDDAVGPHEHGIYRIVRRGDASFNRDSGWNGDPYSNGYDTVYTNRQGDGRWADVTRPKSVGVNYVIKAVSGYTEEDADTVLANVQQYIQDSADLFPYPGHTVYGLTVDSTRHVSINSDALLNGAYMFRQTFADVATGSWTIVNTGTKDLAISRYGGRGSSAVDRIVTFSTLSAGSTLTFTLDSDDPYLDSNTFSIEAIVSL